jgi:hypothetical protein
MPLNVMDAHFRSFEAQVEILSNVVYGAAAHPCF